MLSTLAQSHADEHNGQALIIVLDHITDAGNLGAIARSAEIVGASGILIPNKRSARVTAATYKSSAGAISHIKVAQVGNIAQTIERLKKVKFLGCGRFLNKRRNVFGMRRWLAAWYL